MLQSRGPGQVKETEDLSAAETQKNQDSPKRDSMESGL